MLRKTVQAALAILVSGLISGLAHAHPALEAANPGRGATVSPPKEMRLTFTDSVIPKFSGLTAKDQSGSVIDAGKATTQPTEQHQLARPVPKPLSPGPYEC